MSQPLLPVSSATAAASVAARLPRRSWFGRNSGGGGVSARTPFFRSLFAWLLALCVAGAGTVAIVSPKTGLMLFSGLLCLGVSWWVLMRPFNGFLLALCLFPWYTLFRGFIKMYHIPLPLGAMGLWPEMILAVMMAGILIGAIQRRDRVLTLSWYDMPVVALLISCLYASVIVVVERRLGLLVYGIHYTTSQFFFYLVARWLRPTRADIRRLITVLVVQYVLLALPSLLDYYFRPMYLRQMAMILRPGFWRNWDPIMFFGWYPRMHSLMFAELHWGALSAFLCLICLASLGLSRRPRWLWPIMGLSTLGLALSMARGPYVCFAVAIGVYFLISGGHRRSLAKIVAAAVLIGVPAMGWVAQTNPIAVTIVNRVLAMADPENQDAWNRVPQWKRALDDFALYPAGTGLGTKGMAATNHGDGGSVWDGGIFKVLAEQGVPGTLTFVVGLAACIYAWGRLLKGATGIDRVIGMVSIAFLAGTAIQNIAQNAFELYYINPLLWLVGGLFVARRLAPGDEPDNDKASAGAALSPQQP